MQVFPKDAKAWGRFGVVMAIASWFCVGLAWPLFGIPSIVAMVKSRGKSGAVGLAIWVFSMIANVLFVLNRSNW
jgi:hypothetical protein